MARKKKAEVTQEPIIDPPPRYVETLDGQRFFVIMRISDWIYLVGLMGHSGTAAPMYSVPIDETRDITDEIERAVLEKETETDLAKHNAR